MKYPSRMCNVNVLSQSLIIWDVEVYYIFGLNAYGDSSML